MAKKKQAAAEEVVAVIDRAENDSAELVGTAPSADAPSADVALPFIGQWNRLVSTTNWEKGRIICQWREALELAAAPVTTYSDEAWAQLVGGVTSQHVGRLRRVYQKFGPVFDQYDGLFWSHFQAGLDWEDAEMWLEGAILNGWSVSQMRGKRWETLGNAGSPPEDAAAEDQEGAPEASPPGEAASAAGRASETADLSPPWEPSDSDSESEDEEESNDSPSRESSTSREDSPTAAAPAKSRSRLAVDVDELPQDIADAFEQFKLAIITQRRLSWSETTPEAVIECLDALRDLALAPSDD